SRIEQPGRAGQYPLRFLEATCSDRLPIVQTNMSPITTRLSIAAQTNDRCVGSCLLPTIQFAWPLFVAQRCNRIQLRSSARRIIPEENSDARGEEPGEK